MDLILTNQEEITEFLTNKISPTGNSHFYIKGNRLLSHIVFQRNYANLKINNGFISIISLKDMPAEDPALIPGELTNDSPQRRYYDIKIDAIEKNRV